MKKIISMGLVAAAVAAGVAALSLSQAPQAVAASDNKCIDAGSLQSRMIIDRNKVLVEDSFGRTAILTLSQPCSQMDEMDRVGFIFNGTTQVCGPHDVQILYSRMNERPVQCIINDVQILTAAEAKAYTSSSSRR
ncbi:MAG: DUF6491 family protein [Asticcacaulis sp.]